MSDKDTKQLLPWNYQNGAPIGARGEAASFCRRLITSDQYRLGLEQRLLKGTLPPALEVLIWHYAVGKPADEINVSVSEKQDLSQLTVEDLQKRLTDVRNALDEVEQAEQTLNTSSYTVQ